MVDKFTRNSCIPGMLLFGTATVVIQKYVFDMSAPGRDDKTMVPFQKPWFQTESMFMGMLSCLIVYEITRCIRKSRATKDAEAGLLPQEDDSIQHWKHYFYVGAPAMCDLSLIHI